MRVENISLPSVINKSGNKSLVAVKNPFITERANKLFYEMKSLVVVVLVSHSHRSLPQTTTTHPLIEELSERSSGRTEGTSCAGFLIAPFSLSIK